MTTANDPENQQPQGGAADLGQISKKPSATAAAAAKVTKPKKAKTVSHAKPQEQTPLPLPAGSTPEFGMMPTARIRAVMQVRKNFDESQMLDLTEDIAKRGIMQPLVIRRAGDDFLLVAGERRLRAAQALGLAEVPVVIHDMTADEHELAQLAENIQRADLSLQEEADAIARLYEKEKSVVIVGKIVHKSVAWVSKRLSLSRGLGHYASALMADGITEDIELLQAVDKLEKVTGGSNATWALCEKIRRGEAGREDAREALRRATDPKPQPEKVPPAKPAEPGPYAESQWFRTWLAAPHPHAEDYIACLFKEMASGVPAEKWQAMTDELTRLREQVIELHDARTKLLNETCHDVVTQWGKLGIDTAWRKFCRETNNADE